MSHSHAPQSEKHGGGHHSQTPQVAVRDGNRLVCPCCGEVLMILPERPIEDLTVWNGGQAHAPRSKADPRRTCPELERVIARQEAQELGADQAPIEEEPRKYEPNPEQPGYRADPIVIPIDPEVAAHAFPEVNPPKIPKPVKPPELRLPSGEYRPKPTRDWNTRHRERERRREKKPLRDPFTYEGARLFAWTYYRLQKLDRQLHEEIGTKQEEIDRLQLELDRTQAGTTRGAQPLREASSAGSTSLDQLLPDFDFVFLSDFDQYTGGQFSLTGPGSGCAMSDPQEDLVPVFVPALAAVLINAEDKKGTPLTTSEVIRIRDNAVCIMMTQKDAAKMEQSRYRDIDPENCWYEFQMLRRELGRKPDLDPGPKFNQVSSEDPEYLQTINDAQATLDQFRAMLPDDGSPVPNAMVKTIIEEGEKRAFMWLMNTVYDGDAFVATFFEVPQNFTQYAVGDSLRIASEDVLDWMVNDGGSLHGGYSIRYQRERKPEAERAEYDQYIGITEYL